MQLERIRPNVLRLTLHTMELSSLVAAARLALDDPDGELPVEAREQLRQVLATYDDQVARLGPS